MLVSVGAGVSVEEALLVEGAELEEFVVLEEGGKMIIASVDVTVTVALVEEDAAVREDELSVCEEHRADKERTRSKEVSVISQNCNGDLDALQKH